MTFRVVLLAALVPLAGCDDLGAAAAAAHAEAFGCAKSAVQATPRRDVDAYALLFGGRQPPSALKNNPAALEAWKAKRAQDHATFVGSGDVFEAKGCGHEALWFCKRDPEPGAARCAPLDQPAGGTR